MNAGKIVWLKVKQEVRRWLPVDEPKPADHRPYYVWRGGGPTICCDKHPFYHADPPPTWRGY